MIKPICTTHSSRHSTEEYYVNNPPILHAFMEQEIMVVSVQSWLFAIPLFLSKANKVLDSLFG